MAEQITKQDIMTDELKAKIIELTLNETPKEEHYLLDDFIQQIKNL